ncbi:MAG: alpha-glucan family phosphorylase, partial [Nitrospinota bacterium]
MKYLYEVSWEICNKVGGIYTVLRTKTGEAVKHFGENYFVLGPNLEKNSDFTETEEPLWERLQPALKEKGLSCRLGRWDIPGKPRAVLVDFKERYDSANLLYNLWKDFGVDSYAGHWDYIEPVLFSTACAEVIETVHNTLYQEGDESIAHFHEWMCGGGLLYIKKHSPEIGTVFTTHATVLGRSLSENRIEVQEGLAGKNPRDEARHFNVSAKHSMEAATAREADCFTTVSDITAEESLAILNKFPDHIVNNGLNIRDIPNVSRFRKRRDQNREHLLTLSRKILQKELPEQTKFILHSGRYEFHNKGIDVFLESLARLENEISHDSSVPPVVAFVLLAAGHQGVSEEVKNLIQEDHAEWGKPAALTTHIIDEHNDPVIQTCHKLGLRNVLHNKVNVIFSTAYLDGNDGVFNLPYYDIASACDLGVFPSFYEPWGYTPLECAAHAVPVVTTDLTGFGRWANDLSHSPGKGVTVMRRKGRQENTFISDFTFFLHDFLKLEEKELANIHKQARQIAQMADWRLFYRNYLDAYMCAVEKAAKRSNLLDTSSFSDRLFTSFSGVGTSTPHYRNFTSALTLPKELDDLLRMGRNLWWVWHPDAQKLFEEIDAALWHKVKHNPVKLLHDVSDDVLLEKSKDKKFLTLYNTVVKKYKQYMNSRDGYNKATGAINWDMPIAYFSMEYGFHESLPIYSGGLGVLSGDHLKSASDLNLPLVGVGLLYKEGYFDQTIDMEGIQRENYPFLDCSRAPLKSLLDEKGDEIRVTVEIPGRTLFARVWEVFVGRVKLYLLDTDIPENSPEDRKVTSRLFGGDRAHGLIQEILLGFGGLKLLREELNIKPSVYHINEGHASFLMLKRIKRFMGTGLNYQEAREAVKASSVFTTHTPVPAGNETFEVDLLKYYLYDFVKEIGISWEEFLELGWEKPEDEKAHFSMTVLALKLTSKANGVAKLHGKVARKMWLEVWSGVNEEEIPISSITNGIHLSTWMGDEMRLLLEKHLGIKWEKECDNAEAWKKIENVPKKALWDTHQAQKKKALDEIKERIALQYKQRGDEPQLLQETLEKLDHKIFTIGFARRFALYKRGALIFKDLKRFLRMANDSQKPVQLIIAGKAHPVDQSGKDVIKYIVDLGRSKELRGRVIFLENYDIAVGRLLTQGVDL